MEYLYFDLQFIQSPVCRATFYFAIPLKTFESYSHLLLLSVSIEPTQLACVRETRTSNFYFGSDMSAMKHGYHTIDDEAPATGADSVNAKQGRLPGDGYHGQAVTRASAAAVGARDAVTQAIYGPTPEVNLYTEPFNPSAQLTFRDRMQLVLESCRPWSEFLDLKAFNAPAPLEAKLRIGHNLEIFFYNYVVIGFSLLALTALFHPIQSLIFAFVVLVGALMYIILPENYRITDNFYITRSLKHIIMALMAFLALTMGHVLSLFVFFTSIFLPVTIIHAFFREHAATGMPTI